MWLFDFQIKEFKKGIDKIMENGLLFDSIYTKKFEKEFSRQFNYKYTLSMPSGTSAIETVLFALKTKSVAIPALTVPEVYYACKKIAKKIYFYDVSKYLPVASNDEIKDLLNKHNDIDTMIYVHTAGLSLIDEIDLPDNIRLVEDCSHSHGIKEYGKYGDVSIYSFFTTKVLSGGTGIIASNNEEIITECEKYSRRKYLYESYTFHTHEIPALLSYLDTKHWKKIVEERRRQARIYHEHDIYSLQDILYDKKGIKPTYYKFTISPKPKHTDKLFLTGYTHDLPLKNLPMSDFWSKNHVNLWLSRKCDISKIKHNCNFIGR